MKGNNKIRVVRLVLTSEDQESHYIKQLEHNELGKGSYWLEHTLVMRSCVSISYIITVFSYF